MSISNRALIVSLKISQWTGRRMDKEATHTVESTYATDKSVGNYTKKLLPGASELDRITSISGNIRQFFYKHTLPWCSDGSRILPSKSYMEFAAEFRKHKEEFDNAVSEFLRAYPALKESARLKLGNLFKETDYPTVARLGTAFNCEVGYMPVPAVDDFRVEILDSEKDAFLKQMRDVEATAIKECWNRLYEVVNKAAVKLRDPNAIFRDSLLENIQEVCALLPKLNISDSPELEQMRQNVESLITAPMMQPETLRAAPYVRSEAAKQLDEITSKMSVFMGAI